MHVLGFDLCRRGVLYEYEMNLNLNFKYFCITRGHPQQVTLWRGAELTELDVERTRLLDLI